jgi:hypothetical protein
LRFPPLEPETSSLFWLDISVDIALTGQLYRGIRKSNIDFIEISCPPMKRQTIIISDCMQYTYLDEYNQAKHVETMKNM